MQCEICGKTINYFTTYTIKTKARQYKCCEMCAGVFHEKNVPFAKAKKHIEDHSDIIKICANSDPEIKEIVQPITETEMEKVARKGEEKRAQQDRLDSMNTKLLTWFFNPCDLSPDALGYNDLRVQIEDDIDYWIKKGWSVVSFQSSNIVVGEISGRTKTGVFTRDVTGKTTGTTQTFTNYECLLVRNKPRAVVEE